MRPKRRVSTTSKPSFYLEFECPLCHETIALNIIKKDLKKAFKGKRETVRYRAYRVN